MKKILSILLVQMAFTLNIIAQDMPSLYLTGYTFSAKNRAVGDVKSLNGEKILSVKIGGKDASAFTLSKNNTLTLNSKALKNDALWFDITLSVTTAAGTSAQDFRIVKDQFVHSKVVAHRGAFKNTGAAENSIAALNHAVEMGCEGSEFDVQLSADSVLVVNHDPEIQGHAIEKTDSATLLKLKLANGEDFPTLRNFLTAGMKQTRTKLVLEIKPSAISKERAITLTHKVLQMVRALKAEAWIDYISFDYEVCKELVKLAPYAQVAYLKSDKAPAELAADHLTGLDYHFSALQKNPSWIKEARDKKLTINVWTVNDEPVMDWLIKASADYITTNEPELLLKKLRK